MRKASQEFHWNLNLSEIVRIWTNGLIIPSGFMQDYTATFKENETYFSSEKIISILKNSKTEIIENAMSQRVSLDTFWSVCNFWITITTKKLPANLIQAQRNYFRAHTYQKVDFFRK